MVSASDPRGASVTDALDVVALLAALPNTRIDPPPGFTVGGLVEIDWSLTAAGRKRPADERRLVAKVLKLDGDSKYPGWTFIRAESSRTGKTYALVVPPAGTRGWDGPKITPRARR